MNRFLSKFLSKVYSIVYTLSNQNLGQKIKNTNKEKKFELIYKTNYWKSKITGSRSGRGSDNDSTENIRKDLSKFLSEKKISSILDIPCGDFYWMSQINLKHINYHGADIVTEIININNKKFKSKNTLFSKLDVVKDNLPYADLLLCRDCLVHLDIDEIFLALDNIKKSKPKFFASTCFLDFSNTLSELDDNWKPINLSKSPFNLRSPDYILDDSNNDQSSKKLFIWKNI